MKGAIHAKSDTRGLKPEHYQNEQPKKIIGLLSGSAKIYYYLFSSATVGNSIY